MENSFQSYALAPLTSMGSQEDVNHDNPPLEIAIRRDGTLAVADTSSFNIPARSLLRFLIEHSPSPETIARLFIMELARCEIPTVKYLVNTLNSSGRSVSPDDWGVAVQAEIRQTGEIMKHLTDPASFFLTCLIVGFRKRSVEKVPIDRTPNRTLHDLILELAAVERREEYLQELIVRRDGRHCFLTGSVMLHCTRIIPFSIHNKPILHYAIEMFTSHRLRTENIRHLINHPANAINIGYHCRVSMERKLAWGIEARLVNNEWKYYFRVVKDSDVPCIVTHKDGDEIQFGRGSYGDMIALPDPWACNLHLAICRVFAASGAAKVVDKYLENFGDDR